MYRVLGYMWLVGIMVVDVYVPCVGTWVVGIYVSCVGIRVVSWHTDSGYFCIMCSDNSGWLEYTW